MTPRRQHSGSRARRVVITSGKGGVGKTNVVANLAVALASLDQRVVVLDADYGLGNIDILFGLDPALTVESVLDGRATLGEVLMDAADGVRVLPATSGAPELAFLSNEQRTRLREALVELDGNADWLLVDTATGISENVVSWLEEADETLLVASTDPASIVDAYAMAKLAARLGGPRPIRLVVNNVADEREASDVHLRLDTASQQFLGEAIDYLGHVVRDPLLAEAMRQRLPLLHLNPRAPASRCFRRLGRRLIARAPLGPALAQQEDAEFASSVR